MFDEKTDIITFKAPEYLKEALKGIPNRSEFIRNAILAALGCVCPLCKGSGILLPNQKEHWKRFTKDHFVTQCKECNALHLVCERTGNDPAHSEHGGK